MCVVLCCDTNLMSFLLVLRVSRWQSLWCVCVRTLVQACRPLRVNALSHCLCTHFLFKLSGFLPSFRPFFLSTLRFAWRRRSRRRKEGSTRSIAKVNIDPGGQLEASVQLARQLHYNILYVVQNQILRK